MMEYTTTVRAESVERAIKIGLTKLGISQDQAIINVISEGKKGLFGFGKQDAIVEISKSINGSYADLTKELEKTHDLSGQEKTEDFKTSVKETKEAVIEQTQEVARTVKDASDTAFQHAKETTESVVSAVTEKVQETDEAIRETYQAIKEDVTETTSDLKESLAASQEVADAEVHNSQTIDFTSQHEQVARQLEAIIREYGADARITVETGRNQVIFNIDTEKSGLIIGKHGKIINALQVLAQMMVHQYDKRRQSILLNIGDYRDRRQNVLEQIAERTAKEVLRTKRTVVLDPLPSYERKQIHAYLSKIENISTHSEGRDPNRYLVVEYQA